MKFSFSDVAVIGAGPVGSMAGFGAVKGFTNNKVWIFESKSTIGAPIHCSGLIARSGLKKLGLTTLDVQDSVINSNIDTARFYAPNYDSFDIKKKKDPMIVVNRKNFDNLLAKRAKIAGSDIFTGRRVVDANFDGKNWNLKIKVNKKIILHKCKILISAEGINAKIANSIVSSTSNQKWLFPGFQYDLTNVIDVDTSVTELFFGSKYAPGFFAWFIPLSEESARVGLAVSPSFKGSTKKRVELLCKKHPVISKRLIKSKIIGKSGGLVPVSGPIKRTYNTNFMVVGDAAGQTKSTTGGGVNIGGYCGYIAGRISSQVINGELPAQKAGVSYEKHWKRLFGNDLLLMKLTRRMLTPLPDKTWNNIIMIAKETDLSKSLQSSDIDLHGKGLLKYVISPKVIYKSLKVSPEVILSFVKGMII